MLSYLSPFPFSSYSFSCSSNFFSSPSVPDKPPPPTLTRWHNNSQRRGGVGELCRDRGSGGREEFWLCETIQPGIAHFIDLDPKFKWALLPENSTRWVNWASLAARNEPHINSPSLHEHKRKTLSKSCRGSGREESGRGGEKIFTFLCWAERTQRTDHKGFVHSVEGMEVRHVFSCTSLTE